MVIDLEDDNELRTYASTLHATPFERSTTTTSTGSLPTIIDVDNLPPIELSSNANNSANATTSTTTTSTTAPTTTTNQFPRLHQIMYQLNSRQQPVSIDLADSDQDFSDGTGEQEDDDYVCEITIDDEESEEEERPELIEIGSDNDVLNSNQSVGSQTAVTTTNVVEDDHDNRLLV